MSEPGPQKTSVGALDADIKKRGGHSAVAKRAGQRAVRLRAVQTSAPDGEVDQDDELSVTPGSDDALALQFVDRHIDDFRRTHGMGWMRNAGDLWTIDTEMAVFDQARLLCREAAADATDPREAKRLSSAKTVAAVINMAQSDPRIATPASAWDALPYEINTPGGIVDLRSGRMRKRKSDLMTQVTRVAPNSKAPDQNWQRFLSEIFEGDAAMIEFMQRLVGYTLTADRREQKLFFMFGLGSNGKSTFWDVVQWITHTYALKLPASTLMRSRVETHPTELAQLRGKRLAISSEPDEGQHFNEARIKELTGDETLTARYMRQDFFEFPQTQKHVLVGNYRPRFQGGDAAMARRMVLVQFNATFAGKKRDKTLMEKLRAESSSILSWMINGAVKWYADGLCIPKSVDAASNEYMGDNDDLTLWIDECCVRDLLEAKTGATLLYQSFSHWIKARGQHAMAMRTWSERMASIKGLTKIKNSSVQYVGIALNNAEILRINEANNRGYQ
jgi:putative DNA primase/helicase